MSQQNFVKILLLTLFLKKIYIIDPMFFDVIQLLASFLDKLNLVYKNLDIQEVFILKLGLKKEVFSSKKVIKMIQLCRDFFLSRHI